MRGIYLDNNATTPLLPPVLEAMLPFFSDNFGNPASSHRQGRLAHKALEDARELIAGLLEAHPDEVIFTSGATEANNLALFGLVGDPPGRLVVSPIEHPCVEEPVRRLTERGFQLSRLPVDKTGVVFWNEASFPPDTRLVSVMLANHETGAVQPIAACGLANAKPQAAVLHCDAAAAVGKMPVSFRQLGVDALSFSAHKFHGPKGIGALILRRSTRLRPQLWGGHQQQGRRPGTEATALVVGCARALELAVQAMDRNISKVNELRNVFLSLLQANAAPVILNGPQNSIPGTLNLSFPGCRADALLMALDLAGVCCSTGSACSSGSLLPSPVLQAMGVDKELLHWPCASALARNFRWQTWPKPLDASLRWCISCDMLPPIEI